MKVAMLTPLFLPVRGGTEVHVYNLAKRLIGLGVQVEVHTSRDTYTERGVLPPEEEIDGIKVVRHSRGWELKGDFDLAHFHNMHRMFTLWNARTVAFSCHRAEGRCSPPTTP